MCNGTDSIGFPMLVAGLCFCIRCGAVRYQASGLLRPRCTGDEIRYGTEVETAAIEVEVVTAGDVSFVRKQTAALHNKNTVMR